MPRLVVDNAPMRVETEDFAVDLESRTAWNAAGDSLDFTPMQWRLVEFFVRNPGRVLTQTQLLHAGWGFRDAGDTEYVPVAVARIREKLERDPARPRYLVTVPGEGFRFVLADGRRDESACAPDTGSDPVELLIRAFAITSDRLQIEQRADLLRLLCDQRAVPALLARLCESRVNDDADVEDAVCGALVALGVMQGFGNRRFRVRRLDSLSASARQAVEQHLAFVPRRYWAPEVA